MSGTTVSETRTYNVVGQLTHLTGLNAVNLTYNYPGAGANNGQIASQYDASSGETITYAYDSLKRLASATSTQGWNQGFGYDGFGDLTSKTGSGVAPMGSYPADPATNRLSGTQYDSNGNQLSANSNTLVYDVSNRMISSTGQSLQGFYEYDASNKRVYQQKRSFNGSAVGDECDGVLLLRVECSEAGDPLCDGESDVDVMEWGVDAGCSSAAS